MRPLSEPTGLVQPPMQTGQHCPRHEAEAHRERLALSLQSPGRVGRRIPPPFVIGPDAPGDRLQ
jgi:hypothetical protein